MGQQPPGQQDGRGGDPPPYNQQHSPQGNPPHYYGPPPRQGLHPAAMIGIAIGGGCLLIALIGIVATVAIPIMLSARANNVREQARNSLRTVASAEAAYYAETASYADLPDLASAGYLDQSFAENPADMGHGVWVNLSLAEDRQSYTADVVLESEIWTVDESGDVRER